MPKKLHRIKEVLEEQEKSGYWLAKETEISYNSIHGYIKGRIEPSLTNLFRIAEALKINPRELINSDALQMANRKIGESGGKPLKSYIEKRKGA